MYGVNGILGKKDMAMEYQSQIPVLRPSIHARRANMTVKFQDLYGFTVEGNVDDVNVLNEVREKVRQQGKVWWGLDADKGANWYLEAHDSSSRLKSSLNFSSLVNAMTLKKLIRKGIPPNFRPKIWFNLSGAAKKKSTVPDSYYNDLTAAVVGKVTAATKQIDHVCVFCFHFSTFQFCFLGLDCDFMFWVMVSYLGQFSDAYLNDSADPISFLICQVCFFFICVVLEWISVLFLKFIYGIVLWTRKWWS